MLDRSSPPAPAASAPLRPVAAIPPFTLRAGRYTARFAHTAADLDALQRLRFAVFNLELGEGLAASRATGRDIDTFDSFCHHLMIVDDTDGAVVGTYRMQTQAMAAAGAGFYAASMFDLAALPGNLRAEAVEIGRACIARNHRTPQVLYLLWRGLATYAQQRNLRYLFGCCSLTSQQPADGWHVLELLRARAALHPTLHVPTLPTFACPPAQAQASSASIPRLFRAYLRYGASVCSPPAIDRQFGTIDYLVLCDLDALDAPTRRFFLGAP